MESASSLSPLALIQVCLYACTTPYTQWCASSLPHSTGSSSPRRHPDTLYPQSARPSAQFQGLEVRQKYPSKPPPDDMAEARPTPTPGQPGNAGIPLKASLNCQVISSSTASFSKTVIYSKMLSAAKHGGGFWNPFDPSKSSLSLKFLLSPLTHRPQLCSKLLGHHSRRGSSKLEVT